MLRRLSIASLAVLASMYVSAAKSKQNDDPAFSQIDSIVKSLSEISGFMEKHPVPYGRMSKRQLRQFLTRRLKKTLRPEEIYADELALKMFGLVPQTFDLRRSTIDLLTEQAAAFYDYDQKKLFLLEESDPGVESTTLAHELSHALADQYFDLNEYMDDAPSNDDENLARTAVVEGEASWLMIAYELRRSGHPPSPTEEMLKSVGESSSSSMIDYPVLKNSPLYIQQSLLFPYTEGVEFFNAVYQKLGKPAFAAVFKDPPKDSAQIIHPDRYFAHRAHTSPHVPELVSEKPAKEITEGSMGEFDHEILLWQYLGEKQAKVLAPHLTGGQFKIAANGKDKRPILLYSSGWDTEESASNFFAAYQTVLHAKWKMCDVSLSNASTFAGTGDNGYFVAKLLGDKVSIVEGLSDRAEWDRLKSVERAQR